MSSVSSSSFAERASAVSAADAAAEVTCRATVAALNNKIREAHDLAIADKAAALRAAEARFDELDAVIATDVLAELAPLARAYPETPRAMAKEVAAVWRAANDRARSELGQDVHCSILGVAFALAAGFEDRFGQRDSWHFDGGHPAANAADVASRAILGGGHDAVVDGVLRALEIAVVSQGQATAHVDAERARAKRSRATVAGMRSQEERVDRERAAAVKPSGMAPGSRIW